MSDETTGTEPQGTATITPTTQPATPETPAQEIDWKAEARKWEERAKANRSAAEKLAEIEEASKTEAQRMAERLAKAEERVAAFERSEQVNRWRDEVAKATGVPANVLKGSTREELEEHANTLKSLITPPETRKGLRGPYVPTEGTAPAADLAGDPLEAAIRQKLGI